MPDQITESEVSQPQSNISPPLPTTVGKRSKTVMLVVVLIILPLSLFINFLQFRGLLFQGNTNKSFPINPSNSYVKGYGPSYYLESQIEEIKKDSNGMELITDIKDSKVPRFYIDSKTSVYAESNGSFRPIRAEELKNGQKVLIYIYRPQMENWVTSRVTILP